MLAELSGGGESLHPVMRPGVIDIRPFRNDLGRIDGRVAVVVMGFDVFEIYGTGDTRYLV